jgi:hypothetical protein
VELTPQQTLEVSPRAEETVYRLPPAPPASRRRRLGLIELQLGVLFLLAAAGVVCAGLAEGRGRGVLVLWGAILGPVTLLLLLDGYGKRYGRPRVRADRHRLRFWEALLARWSARDRPLPAVVRFVVHPIENDLGVLEVVSTDVQPYWFADGYPLPMLRNLADRLARHCDRHRQHPVPVEGGPPISESKLAALQAASVRDEETADLKERPTTTRWEVTRSPGGVTLVQPPCRQEGLRFILAVLVCGALGVGLLIAGTLGPREQRTEVSGVVLLLASVGAAVYGLHAGTRERRVTARDGQLSWGESSRVVPRRRPRRWSVDDLRALRAFHRSGGGLRWELHLHTRDGLSHHLYASADGDEVRWLATELRGALGVPAVERPEADGPTE